MGRRPPAARARGVRAAPPGASPLLSRRSFPEFAGGSHPVCNFPGKKKYQFLFNRSLPLEQDGESASFRLVNVSRGSSRGARYAIANTSTELHSKQIRHPRLPNLDRIIHSENQSPYFSRPDLRSCQMTVSTSFVALRSELRGKSFVCYSGYVLGFACWFSDCGGLRGAGWVSIFNKT